MGAVMSVSASGAAESSDPVASVVPEAMATATRSTGAGSVAPQGTGHMMVSERSQLHLDEPSFPNQSDCMQHVSTLQDAEEFASCMEVPRTANCLQVTVGYQESDSWWECFVDPVVCEVRMAEHDVLWQLVKDARAILQACSETALASVVASP